MALDLAPFPTLLRIAYRMMGSMSDAEDVVQDVLVSVARKLPGFRYEGEKGSFKAWLVMIVKSRIIDHLRHRHVGCLCSGEGLAGE